tara:strand:+ start:512 stop:1675 length:1164 start_codon:yes stop_codon:yes gene_type:complete
MNFNTLFVIVPDKLSELIEKGEITKRYYNPGDLFENVHLILTNSDTPNLEVIQKTVGSAKLYIHNVHSGKRLFFLSLFYREYLLKIWSRSFIKLAKKYKPNLIRCHGASLNSFAAAEIKKKLNIPYLISLHTNYDEDQRKRASSLKEKILYSLNEKIEIYGLKNADLIMPVYKPIVPYLKRLNLEKYKVLYNVINPDNIQKKENYKIKKTLKLISVGRQFEHKNPIKILKSLSEINNVHLTLIGNGNYHKYLKNKSIELGVKNKVKFIPSMSNDALCRSLKKYDLFVVHTEYWEISKSILEALLTGMPIIINNRIGLPVPELNKKLVHYVDNSKEDYKHAILNLRENHEYRQKLGESAKSYAEKIWSPEVTEKKFVDIYKKFAIKYI